MATRLIAVVGGSASGKTTLARQMVEIAGDSVASVVALDAFYLANNDKTQEERAAINYDHPDAFDSALVCVALQRILSGERAYIPRYDFATHSRLSEADEVVPTDLVVVEGILTLNFPMVAALFDYSVFVDTPDHIRLARRIQRDVAERGRTEDGVLSQWNSSVQPIFLRYCLPMKERVSEVFSGIGWSKEDVENLLHRINDC